MEFQPFVKVKVKCIYKGHLKTTHVDQSAAQLDYKQK